MWFCRFWLFGIRHGVLLISGVFLETRLGPLGTFDSDSLCKQRRLVSGFQSPQLLLNLKNLKNISECLSVFWKVLDVPQTEMETNESPDQTVDQRAPL